MGAMQRTKGADGERTVAILIRYWLGLEVHRNWQGQAAAGGADLSGVPGWAIEIKRAKEYRHEWWGQAVAQAEQAGAAPALVFLIDYTRRGQHPLDRWRVILPLATFGGIEFDHGETAEISLRAWFTLIRESLTTRGTPGQVP